MPWSQESAEILTTVLRNSVTAGRVVAMDVDIDAVEQDALPSDEVIEAVLYRRDEGADARLDGAIANRGSVARVASGDGDGGLGRTYRLVFDAPETGTYQVVIHWPRGDDTSGVYHHEAVAIPGTQDGLLRVN